MQGEVLTQCICRTSQACRTSGSSRYSCCISARVTVCVRPPSVSSLCPELLSSRPPTSQNLKQSNESRTGKSRELVRASSLFGVPSAAGCRARPCQRVSSCCASRGRGRRGGAAARNWRVLACTRPAPHARLDALCLRGGSVRAGLLVMSERPRDGSRVRLVETAGGSVSVKPCASRPPTCARASGFISKWPSADALQACRCAETCSRRAALTWAAQAVLPNAHPIVFDMVMVMVRLFVLFRFVCFSQNRKKTQM